MKKLVLGMALAGSLVCANDVSGAFVGLGLGVEQGKATGKTADATNKMKGKVGLDVEVLAGYKHLFNNYFGIRGYGQLVYAPTIKYKASQGTDTFKGSNFEINANVDVLANFINNSSYSLGGYLGLGFGAINYGKWKRNGETSLKAKTGFNTALNLGVRSVIATNHGIELGVRIPFVPVKHTENDMTIKRYKTYAINARYVYNF